MSRNGKGHAPRPFSVPPEVFEENWARIFKKNKEAIKSEASKRAPKPGSK